MLHSQIKRRHRRGISMMMVMVVVVMLLALLIAFGLNNFLQTSSKVEGITIADESAAAAAKIKGNAMNALTRSNHQIGEVLAFLMVHHGLGGDLLDNGQIAERHAKPPKRELLNRRNDELSVAQEQAQDLGASTDAYETVRQQDGIRAEATLLDAKIKLKEYLTQVYWLKVAAKIMQMYPPTAPAGRALEQAMDAFERVIKQEYKFLNRVQSAAEDLLSMKERLRDRVLPSLKEYTTQTVERTPGLVRDIVRGIARSRGVERAFVVNPELPVEIDPLSQAMTLPNDAGLPESSEADPSCCRCKSVDSDITRDQINKVTQLARASFPWVVYQREPVLKLLRVAKLSKAKELYKDYSDGAAKQLSNRYQMEGIRDARPGKGNQLVWMGLYVIKDYVAPDQGYAKWADDAMLAHGLFSTTVVVLMPPAEVIGDPAFYGQHHADGQLYFAQGVIYNANNNGRHQRRINLTCKRITPNRQADFGTDTLNWDPLREQDGTIKRDADGLAMTPCELVAKLNATNGAPRPYYPQIRLNWQSRLEHTPVDAVKRLKSSRVPDAIRVVLDNVPEQPPTALLTH